MSHAVGRVGPALAGLPATQLRVEVVARQAQQAWDVGGYAGKQGAVALRAGRDFFGGVALRGQGSAALQKIGWGGGAGRPSVGQIKLGEILRDFHQVGVRQRLQQAGHQGIVAAPIAQVDELVVEVARRFAGDARVIAVRPGTAFFAMAAGAGQGALGHGVFKRGGGSGGGSVRGAAQARCEHACPEK